MVFLQCATARRPVAGIPRVALASSPNMGALTATEHVLTANIRSRPMHRSSPWLDGVDADDDDIDSCPFTRCADGNYDGALIRHRVTSVRVNEMAVAFDLHHTFV